MKAFAAGRFKMNNRRFLWLSAAFDHIEMSNCNQISINLWKSKLLLFLRSLTSGHKSGHKILNQNNWLKYYPVIKK